MSIRATGEQSLALALVGPPSPRLRRGTHLTLPGKDIAGLLGYCAFQYQHCHGGGYLAGGEVGVADEFVQVHRPGGQGGQEGAFSFVQAWGEFWQAGVRVGLAGGGGVGGGQAHSLAHGA